MIPFQIKKLSPHITQIRDASGVFLFLAEGTQRALLIDTGSGFVGLKETVARLTRKPLTVILTHMHPDHAGGAADFDRIYVHPADIPAFREQSVECRMDYTRSQLPPGETVTAADFLPPVADGRCFVPMEDGTVFDLGGFHVQSIHVPGHTPGSSCILFREERSILFGDACNINTLIMFGTTLTAYRSALLRLQTFREQFDTVYYSHGPQPEGPGQSLEDNIALCTEILEGKDDAIACDFLGMPAIRAKAIDSRFLRLDGKYGNIVYTPQTKR